MPKRKIPFIEIIDNRRNRVGNYPVDAYFYLEMDDWNDHQYYTSYHLHASKLVTEDGSPLLIGHLRILKQGQKTGIQERLRPGSIDGLEDNYCSMAGSLDYYERISQLAMPFRDLILIGLRDCIINRDYKEELEEEEGFYKSLMRHTSKNDEIFTLAPLLITRNFHKLLDMDLSFEFSVPELEKPLEFNFNSPTYGFNEYHLPNRISVIIGRNGSGKSTILSRLSRLAFSSASDRRDINLKKVGVISPPGLGFTRIILLSYSAFDAFNTPGIYKSDKETILLEMKNGLGRYVFCGIRNIVSELEASIESLETDDKGKLTRKDILQDRIENTKLKSIQELSIEFVRTIRIIIELAYEPLLATAINLLAKEKSMYELFPEDWESNSDKQLENMFKKLSTGHKFVVHAITSIIAYAAPRSLLLFDEPETHLHPPILAALMKAIRHVLEKRNAFMIAATHSPVVLQETLMQHVYVIQREGDIIKGMRPEIETFGENTGILTQAIFGLTAEVTDYHGTLDRLVRESTDDLVGTSDPQQALEMIEAKFSDGLSMQARSYVLSKLYSKK